MALTLLIVARPAPRPPARRGGRRPAGSHPPGRGPAGRPPPGVPRRPRDPRGHPPPRPVRPARARSRWRWPSPAASPCGRDGPVVRGAPVAPVPGRCSPSCWRPGSWSPTRSRDLVLTRMPPSGAVRVGGGSGAGPPPRPRRAAAGLPPRRGRPDRRRSSSRTWRGWPATPPGTGTRRASSPTTPEAVPPILTGGYPDGPRHACPTVTSTPTTSSPCCGRTYDENVQESVTALCPADLCGRGPSPRGTRCRAARRRPGPLAAPALGGRRRPPGRLRSPPVRPRRPDHHRRVRRLADDRRRPAPPRLPPRRCTPTSPGTTCRRA